MHKTNCMQSIKYISTWEVFSSICLLDCKRTSKYQQNDPNCDPDQPWYSISLIKVRMRAKIRIRYNQVPHLTQDTTWESDKYTSLCTHWIAQDLSFPMWTVKASDELSRCPC